MNDDWKEKFEKELAERKQTINELFQHDMFDEDGYPTDEALQIVKLWHWDDIPGWFKFIKELWWMPDWGWKEIEEPHSRKKNEMVKEHHISTGGWSGNESIIHAMEKNDMMWHLCWEQSRRGGHYIFQEYKFKDDKCTIHTKNEIMLMLNTSSQKSINRSESYGVSLCYKTNERNT